MWSWYMTVRTFCFVSGWWFIADDVGHQGWAPATYLEPVATTEGDDVDDWISVTDANGQGMCPLSILHLSFERCLRSIFSWEVAWHDHV